MPTLQNLFAVVVHHHQPQGLGPFQLHYIFYRHLFPRRPLGLKLYTDVTEQLSGVLIIWPLQPIL